MSLRMKAKTIKNLEEEVILQVMNIKMRERTMKRKKLTCLLCIFTSILLILTIIPNHAYAKSGNTVCSISDILDQHLKKHNIDIER